MERNRIFFKGNPYPKGHLIKKFVWCAHLETGNEDKEDGLYFDFHLETDNYHAEDGLNKDNSEEPESDWVAKIAWENFHRCTISSTEWHFGGFKVADEKNKINLQKLAGKVFLADTPPIDMEGDYENRAFHIYLLGHDACADHHINFKEKNNDGSYNLEWAGKIALAYIGDHDLKYEFEAFIENAKFDEIEIQSNIPLEQSLEKLSTYIENFENFNIEEIVLSNGHRKYKLRFL